MCYNHRNHAGNAGDVWKHFILSEVAGYLIAEENRLIYLESHVGFPEYSLKKPGEWENGIGTCWKHLDALKLFSYFQILDEMNPSGLMNYPGSGTIVMTEASTAGLSLDADVWDIDPDVAAFWRDETLPGSDKIRFHLGDGFSGVRPLLDRSGPGLLLIDPPYLERTDTERARDLLERAAVSGWTVLWWRMTYGDDVPEIHCNAEMHCDAETYFMNFSDVGMVCGKWRGATMTLSGSDDLKDYVNHRAQRFLRILQRPEPF